MSSDRFLLIKACSYTLWGYIEHVLGQLLLAELTNRTPVIYCGTHLENEVIQTNGFELYFEPISNYTIADISKLEYTFYPPIWDSDNLLINDQIKETWAFRNIGDIIGSNANVVVGDVYYNVLELIPFIKKKHPSYGMTVEQTYHYLFSNYIKIKSDIASEIQKYYNTWYKDNHPILAVHVCKIEKEIIFDARGSCIYGNQYWDKVNKKYHKSSADKDKKIHRTYRRIRSKQPNGPYHSEIRKYIDKYNIKKIFLLTDCEETIKEYQKKYEDMLLFTTCKRVQDFDIASQMENPVIKRQISTKLVIDTYLASKCDFFIGNDFSHLSHAVTRIKDWSEKSVKLLYWFYKKQKYPINAKLVVKNERNILLRIIDKAKMFIDNIG